MNYIQYSNSVTDAMVMLEQKGFHVNHWTRECAGIVNGKSCAVTFYPDDEKFILVMKEGEAGKYVSVAELVAILNSKN
jgi:hypothetical protein